MRGPHAVTRLGLPLTLVAVVVLAGSASAQRLTAARLHAPPTPALASAPSAAPSPSPGAGKTFAAGFLGGVAGMVVGIPIGNAIDRARGYDDSCDSCIRWGAAGAAVVGSTIGVALGVHAVHGRQGRFLPVLGRTSAVMGAFWIASFVANRTGADGLNMLIVPTAFVAGTWMANRAEHGTTPSPAHGL